MKNILMLDVNETLLIYDVPSAEYGYVFRPFSDYFVKTCADLFDELYLNTSVPEERALKIMKEKYCCDKFRYWDHNKIGGNNWKANGYEDFRDDRLIHVEDCLNDVVKGRIDFLGHHWIEVPWKIELPPNGMENNDRGLIYALQAIRTLLDK